MKKNIYLDVSALCRSFDDQSYLRIRLETDAVNLIMARVLEGDLKLVISPVHFYEISAISEAEEKTQIHAILDNWGQLVTDNYKKIKSRTEEFVLMGLGLADAAHIAFAEEAVAGFISCDDKLLKRCKRLNLGIWTGSPIAYCEKEDLR